MFRQAMAHWILEKAAADGFVRAAPLVSLGRADSRRFGDMNAPELAAVVFLNAQAPRERMVS